MATGRARMMAIYATGQFGWSLASYGVLNLLAYFYMPPQEGGQALFPPAIFQGNVLAGLTLIGLIGASGRVFDAFTDPLIAQWSDRSRSALGRRRVFLLIAALPFALLSAAVFLPPFEGPGAGNAIWVGVSVALFYLAMTLYVVPYNALIAELGRTARERLHLATAVSVTWALGFALGSQIYLVQDLFEAHLEPRAAFQRSILLFSGLAGLAMLVPALFLQENRYVQQAGHAASAAAADSTWSSLNRVWSDRNFRWFALSDFLYWLALTFIQMGIAYYVVELMGRDKAFASAFMVVVFGLSFLCYAPVNLAAARLGKRKVMLAGFVFFGAAFSLAASLGLGGREPGLSIWVMQGCAAVALAIFGILPNAIVGDLAEARQRREGVAVAGMYFALRTLVMKLGTSAAMLLFPSFLLWGKAGVRASALAALIFCAAGLLAFLRFREQEQEAEPEG